MYQTLLLSKVCTDCNPNKIWKAFFTPRKRWKWKKKKCFRVFQLSRVNLDFYYIMSGRKKCGEGWLLRLILVLPSRNFRLMFDQFSFFWWENWNVLLILSKIPARFNEMNHVIMWTEHISFPKIKRKLPTRSKVTRKTNLSLSFIVLKIKSMGIILVFFWIFHFYFFTHVLGIWKIW